MKKLLSILLTILMLVSVICIAPVSVGAAEVEVAPTGATVSSDGTARLYFNMKAVSWWSAGNNGDGNFAYFFNNNTGKNAWSAHAEKYSGDTYYYVIPAGDWANVIFTRNNTSDSPSWDNKWNQTGDITLSTTSNYVSKFADNSTSVTWGDPIIPASTVSFSEHNYEVEVGAELPLTTTLTSNADINTLGNVTYSVEPATATVTDGVFTATEAGEYTVTAIAAFAPNGYASLTSEATATVTITVTASEVEEPTTQAPATEAPATEAPATETPATETPATETPATETPATETPATEAPAEDTMTVYFTNNKRWSGTIKAYYWGSTIGVNPVWPGYDMTLVETNEYGEGIYSIVVPTDITAIIFNDDGSNQTKDIPASALYDSVGVYVMDDEAGFGTYTYVQTPVEPGTTAATTTAATEAPATDAPVDPDPEEPADSQTVYFVDYVDNFTEVYAYAWSGEGDTADVAAQWPGIKMDLTGEALSENAIQAGGLVYSTTFDKAYENIIFVGEFDDGYQHQTADLTFESGKYCYWGNECWYDSIEAIEEAHPADSDEPDEPAEEYITIYFQNNWMWDDVCCYYDGSAYCDRVEWPGASMDYVDNDGTYDVYSCVIPADADVIVINGIKNDGTGDRDQTPDIEEGFYDGICYWMTWDGGNRVASEDVTIILPDYNFGNNEDDDTEEAPSVAGATLSLGGKLGFSIYFDINDTVMADENAKVVFTVKGETIEVPVCELEYTDYGYSYTIELAAKEMTDVVTAQIVATDFESEIYTTSIKNYAESMLRNYGEYGPEQNIVKAMLNYGTASQIYFGYNTDNLANDSEWMSEVDKVVTVYDNSDCAPVIEGEADAVEFYGASLILESDTYLKFYFKVDESKLTEGEVPGCNINGLPGATLEKNGNLWSITMPSLAAHELDVDFVLEMGNGYTVTYSAYSYIYNAQQSGKTALVNLANALCNYSQEAMCYGGV